jgi:hypothetical protein
MLAWIDCLAFSDLTVDEIRAIADHEHLSQIAALELGNWLVHLPDGSKRLKRVILDELEAASARGDFARAAELRATIKHFCDTHPENQAAKTG